MAASLGKCSRKLRYIVRLRQMIRRWSNKARTSLADRSVPSDVPEGHVAVCVGIRCRRYIVRATYLNHPVFEKLLVQAAEEFEFQNHGPLTIPCDESVFEDVIRFISQTESVHSVRFTNAEDSQRCRHVGARRKVDPWAKSRPLLDPIAGKAIR